MKTRSLIFLIFVFLAVGSWIFFQSLQAQDNGLTFVRQGDPKMGKARFISLRCFHCHRVQMDPELPVPIPGYESKVLGTIQSNQNPQVLVDSLLGYREDNPPESLPAQVRESRLEMKKRLNEASEQDLIDVMTYLRAPK